MVRSLPQNPSQPFPEASDAALRRIGRLRESHDLRKELFRPPFEKEVGGEGFDTGDGAGVGDRRRTDDRNQRQVPDELRRFRQDLVGPLRRPSRRRDGRFSAGGSPACLARLLPLSPAQRRSTCCHEAVSTYGTESGWHWTRRWPIARTDPLCGSTRLPVRRSRWLTGRGKCPPETRRSAASWCETEGLCGRSRSRVHLGCSCAYDDGLRHFVCPGHGSQFALDVTVLHGPATAPLSHLSWQSGPAVNEIEIEGATVSR